MCWVFVFVSEFCLFGGGGGGMEFVIVFWFDMVLELILEEE